MLKDVIIWTFVAVLPFLIVLKNDKQMVHLLEGKLFRRGQDTSKAKAAYERHKHLASALLFVGGCWLAVAGLLILRTSAVAIVVTVGGAACALFGILGRLRSFQAADKDLG